MLDLLPFEIRVEIMKRLPVKSLIQYRSVSKPWKSLIDTSEFVSSYSGYHTHHQHILAAYEEPMCMFLTYVLIADDDDDHTFPHHKLTLTPPLFPYVLYMLTRTSIVGASHGLLCLHSVYRETNVVVLWNLSIRKAIPIVVPNVLHGIYDSFIGFSVCRATIDPKIVKITFIKNECDVERITSIPRQVEVFTLSTRAWRRSYSNLPRKSIQFVRMSLQVVVDGFIYWCASDRIFVDGGYTFCNLIVSFDITSEEFREVKLPDALAHGSVDSFYMAKLRESLVVVKHGVVADNPVIDVWLMEDGVSGLFRRLYTINVNTLDGRVDTPDVRVWGFRMTGEPIIERSEDNGVPLYELDVYDPYTKNINFLGIEGYGGTFFVSPYVETLLLLDQPNLSVYDEEEMIEFLDDLVS